MNNKYISLAWLLALMASGSCVAMEPMNPEMMGDESEMMRMPRKPMGPHGHGHGFGYGMSKEEREKMREERKKHHEEMKKKWESHKEEMRKFRESIITHLKEIKELLAAKK